MSLRDQLLLEFEAAKERGSTHPAADLQWKPSTPPAPTAEKLAAQKLARAWGEDFYDRIAGGRSGGQLPPPPGPADLAREVEREAFAASMSEAVTASSASVALARAETQQAREDLEALERRLAEMGR